MGDETSDYWNIHLIMKKCFAIFLGLNFVFDASETFTYDDVVEE